MDVLLAELERLAQQRYVLPNCFALIYAGLGEKEQALVWLEKAYQEHSSGITNLNVDPMWDSLRTEPRFAELVRRVGLTQ